MARCPHCDYPIPDDRERVGARCHNCRDPLYEPALRFSRRSREGEASCAAHAGIESVSVCARCNRHLCETCRTRWRNVIICAACADRALGSGEAIAARTGDGARQAQASLLMSGGAWLAAAVALLGLWLFSGGSDLGVVFTFLSLVLLTAAVPLAAVGVGQAIAALRGGPRRWLAGAGLALGGLYIGLLMGLGTIALWQN
jgi:hypothetical protein